MDFATTLDLINGVVDFFNALERKFTEGREYRKKRFGSIRGELYYWFGLLNTEEVQRYHFNINLWTKAEAMSWKDSYISKCSAVSVAAAIFASVGQSSLGLENVAQTHWSVSALFTTSMVLGILAVCAAVSLQNAVTGLSNHREVRLWLSKGLSKWYNYPETYQGLLLESSAATVKLSDAPQLLLTLSIISYFLGFGLYLLYGWVQAAVESKTNFRNNFIFYICVLGIAIGYIGSLWASRVMDKDKVNQQFNLKQRFDTGDTDKKIEMLEKWSEIVETLTSAKSDRDKHEARQAMDEVLYVMRFGERPKKDLNKEESVQERQQSNGTKPGETSTVDL